MDVQRRKYETVKMDAVPSSASCVLLKNAALLPHEDLVAEVGRPLKISPVSYPLFVYTLG